MNSKGFVHIFDLFCVLESKKIRTGSDLMLNTLRSASQQ